MADRIPREMEVRAKTTRPATWQPPSVLPEPTPRDGWVFRWVRTHLLGASDPTNVSARRREGWEPVRAEDHPEVVLEMGLSGQAPTGFVEIGGLLLCKAPEEFMQQRTDYYAKHTKDQMDAVNNNYLRENDPRMPVFSDGKSEVRFGSGSK